MNEDVNLHVQYKKDCEEIFSLQPWFKKKYKKSDEITPRKIMKQKFTADGIFLREENAEEELALRKRIQTSYFVEEKEDSLKNTKEHCVLEFLNLYLSGVKIIFQTDEYKEDRTIINDFLENNMKAFRKRADYGLYFKPVFQEIRGLINKDKGKSPKA